MAANTTDWSRLGLRANPFLNVHPGEHLDWVELHPSIEAAVSAPNCRVELVGGKGAGKSTTLKALAARWNGAYVYVPPGAKTLPVLPVSGALLLDEVDRVGVIPLWKDRLVLGVHVSLNAPGFTSLQLEPLVGFGWLERRIAAHAQPGIQVYDFVKLARDVSPRFGNVKYAVLRVLYEVAEDLARGLPANLARAEKLACEDPTVAAHFRA